MHGTTYAEAYGNAENPTYMISEQLYRTEDHPIYGTISDQVRHEPTWYEFGGLGENKYTLRATSDKVAIAAVLIIGGPINPLTIFRPRTCIPVPDLYFNVMADKEFTALFGPRIADFVRENMDAVNDAIQSAGLGTIEMRESLEETLQGVYDNAPADAPQPIVTREEYVEQWTRKQLKKGPHLTNSIKVMQICFRNHGLELADNIYI